MNTTKQKERQMNLKREEEPRDKSFFPMSMPLHQLGLAQQMKQHYLASDTSISWLTAKLKLLASFVNFRAIPLSSRVLRAISSKS